MNLGVAIFSIFTAALLVSCDDSVALGYSTRAEAEAETLFARGWLPGIIPSSSRMIRMRNDLDLNISRGEFQFDPSEHDSFVSKLKRMPAEDLKGETAYSFQGWIFWINHEKNRCRFHLHQQMQAN